MNNATNDGFDTVTLPSHPAGFPCYVRIGEGWIGEDFFRAGLYRGRIIRTKRSRATGYEWADVDVDRGDGTLRTLRTCNLECVEARQPNPMTA